MKINDTFKSFLPGYCQGLTKVFTTYPFDVIKIKLQTNSYKSTIQCFKQLSQYNFLTYIIKYIQKFNIPRQN